MSARVCSKQSPLPMPYIIKSELVPTFFGCELFLPAFSVCGFHFSEVAQQILRSGAACLGFITCSSRAGRRGEATVVHLPSLPLLHLPTHFPWEFEIQASPESLAAFISLCLNPNRIGLTSCHHPANHTGILSTLKKRQINYMKSNHLGVTCNIQPSKNCLDLVASICEAPGTQLCAQILVHIFYHFILKTA